MTFTKKLSSIFVVIALLLLTGCTTEKLGAPCPDFGANCHKVPVNSWDYGE